MTRALNNEIEFNDPTHSECLHTSDHHKDSCGIGVIAHVKGVKSHEIVRDAIDALKAMEHRGALGADGRTGDGVGILLQIPDQFMRHVIDATHFKLPQPGHYGLGVFFGPQGTDCARWLTGLESVLNDLQVPLLGVRPIPTNSQALGAMARSDEPQMAHFFFDLTSHKEEHRDRQLYLVQKQIENAFAARPHENGKQIFHLVHLDRRTIVYKGMMLAHEMGDYFPDLNSPDLISAFAMVHARFSTNTFPSWILAQPFKHLCHNGEINTLRGNLAAMSGREATLAHELFGSSASMALPLMGKNLSDSGFLDQVFKLMLLSGRSLAESHMILMPEAWEKNMQMSDALRAFYEYHAPIFEPWDGPAAVVSTDGQAVCVGLDRNGLRPCRYMLLDDGRVIVASEIGALPVPLDRIVKMGRIGPGELLLIDPTQGGLLVGESIKETVARKKDYRRLVQESIVDIDQLWAIRDLHKNRRSSKLIELQWAFGLSQEELEMVLKPMAEKGEEPVSSMGDDTPPAFLSTESRLLFDYFRQQFAQVTNPPIDPLREELVMSLSVHLGHKHALVGKTQGSLVKLHQPVLTEETLNRILAQEVSGLKVTSLSTLCDVASNYDPKGRHSGERFAETLENLARKAVNASYGGAQVILLSDRGATRGQVPVPMLLAVAAVHQALMEEHLKSRTDIIIESAEVRSVHHLACVLGYGAKAVLPYLALDSIGNLCDLGEIKGINKKSAAEKRYIKALNKGLLKIMSKMGISTLMSYQGAEIFEVLGLGMDLMKNYFPSTPSPIGGIQLGQIEERTIRRHENAYKNLKGTNLPTGGMIHWRKNSEHHSWSPVAIASMQQGVRTGLDPFFSQYKKEVDREDGPPLFIRHLLTFKKQNSIDISTIERAQNIVKQFTTGAMSLGAISREAHETLAIAMNRLGGKSNTGEGGEDPARAKLMPSGDSRLSAIRQVASGRFGVTLAYLLDGRELQIKISQGAKPGEGGQLPGHKVDREIARLRHSTPGVPLISPPPHHDIYSIEDLAQLIYDLRSAHPKAIISVKLVASTGIGAIAAGVVKAGADKVVVSCGSGGTGASPLSSIKHAGMPWEIGISEVHQALVLNGLRSWVKLEVDGQFKTGRDVVIGALLGADEFGFATAPLIATGCIMMRKCHLNTCPVGIATQDPELRAKFTGKPEHVVNFMFWVAEDARKILAEIGLKSLKDCIGRTDLISPKKELCDPLHLDFSRLLRPVTPPKDMGFLPQRPPVALAPSPAELNGSITTAVRSFGALYASEILQKNNSSPPHPVFSPARTEKISLKGYAGQSFGAFLTKGTHLHLEGAANDYVGKGLSGGKITITLPHTASWVDESHSLIGNTVLYGATSGELYVGGAAGERFGVRNSGAQAVVEGLGDHGCEYMTGGHVVVLGNIGKNFGAGMSGGLAFIYGEQNTLSARVNLEMVELEPLTDDEMRPEAQTIKKMLDAHLEYTGSKRAQALLADWPTCLIRFIKVEPKGYRASLARAQDNSYGDNTSGGTALSPKHTQWTAIPDRGDHRHV
jgi:glutamate synthase (NADPH/NADH) large chain